MFDNLRPRGQPVIPIFDGWYPKPTARMIYASVLQSEHRAGRRDSDWDRELDPAGTVQRRPTDALFACSRTAESLPTLLRHVRGEPSKGHAEDSRVTWTLVQKGKTFEVPGHLGSVNYQIQEFSAEDGARSSKAPVIRYLPDGPEGAQKRCSDGDDGEGWATARPLVGGDRSAGRRAGRRPR